MFIKVMACVEERMRPTRHVKVYGLPAICMLNFAQGVVALLAVAFDQVITNEANLFAAIFWFDCAGGHVTGTFIYADRLSLSVLIVNIFSIKHQHWRGVWAFIGSIAAIALELEISRRSGSSAT
jgi:hypothetical protein